MKMRRKHQRDKSRSSSEERRAQSQIYVCGERVGAWSALLSASHRTLHIGLHRIIDYMLSSGTAAAAQLSRCAGHPAKSTNNFYGF
jgi:hypothetical protein